MEKKTGGHRQTEMDSAWKKLKYHLKKKKSSKLFLQGLEKKILRFMVYVEHCI